MNSLARHLYGEFSELGVEVLDVKQARSGAHFKVRCRYRGHVFIYVTSGNHSDANRGTSNFRADIKRIQRAIRTGNKDVLNKFKVKQDEA